MTDNFPIDIYTSATFGAAAAFSSSCSGIGACLFKTKKEAEVGKREELSFGSLAKLCYLYLTPCFVGKQKREGRL